MLGLEYRNREASTREERTGREVEERGSGDPTRVTRHNVRVRITKGDSQSRSSLGGRSKVGLERKL